MPMIGAQESTPQRWPWQKCMTTEELSRTAILLTQLGTTLGTLAALRQMEEGGTGAVTEV